MVGANLAFLAPADLIGKSCLFLGSHLSKGFLPRPSPFGPPNFVWDFLFMCHTPPFSSRCCISFLSHPLKLSSFFSDSPSFFPPKSVQRGVESHITYRAIRLLMSYCSNRSTLSFLSFPATVVCSLSDATHPSPILTQVSAISPPSGFFRFSRMTRRGLFPS